jgi:hypothetical protein
MCAPSRRLFSRTFKLTSSAAAIAAVTALAGTALTQEAPSKDEVFAATSIVSGLGTQKIVSFDISFIDTGLDQYFLADRTNKAIDVVGLSSNNLDHQYGKGLFIGATGDNDTSGPNGVLTVNGKEVWAGDGPHPTGMPPALPVPPAPGVTNLLVFDATSGALTHTINTGGYRRVDEGCFDPRDHVTLWANDAEHDIGTTVWPFVSFVSTDTYAVLGKITMDGTGGTPKATNGIEQCQWSADTGKFYVNIPEVNGPADDSVAGAVIVINPKTMKIEKTWTIDHDACAGPQGMAIGPNNQILLGCNAASGNGNHSTVIINQNTGAIMHVLNNESGADEVWYNPDDGHYFLARSAAFGSSQELGIVDTTGAREDESIPTAGSGTINAHSVAAVNKRAYVPIPGSNGANPNGASTVCGNIVDGTAAQMLAANQQGCIAIFTTTNDDRSRIAHERGPDDKQE